MSVIWFIPRPSLSVERGNLRRLNNSSSVSEPQIPASNVENPHKGWKR